MTGWRTMASINFICSISTPLSFQTGLISTHVFFKFDAEGFVVATSTCCKWLWFGQILGDCTYWYQYMPSAWLFFSLYLHGDKVTWHVIITGASSRCIPGVRCHKSGASAVQYSHGASHHTRHCGTLLSFQGYGMYQEGVVEYRLNCQGCIWPCLINTLCYLLGMQHMSITVWVMLAMWFKVFHDYNLKCAGLVTEVQRGGGGRRAEGRWRGAGIEGNISLP